MARLRLGLLLAALLLAVSVHSAEHDKNKPYRPAVVTALRSSWTTSSLMAEAVEYFGDDGRALWSAADALCAMPIPPGATDRQVYDRMIELADKYLSPVRSALFPAAMGERTLSPRVAAYREAERLVRGNCEGDAFALGSGRTACGLQHLDLLLAPMQGTEDVHALLDELGHEYPFGSDDAPVVRLFARFGSNDFCMWHLALRGLHEARLLRYRYFQVIPDNNLGPDAPQLTISGYGVELAVKSTEYKAVDERTTTEDAEAADARRGRAYVKEAGETDELPMPLVADKVTEQELEGLEFKTAEYILRAEDPLVALSYVSQNLPSLAPLLARRPLPAADLVNGLMRERMNGHMRTQLYINGIPLDDLSIDTLNPHALLQLLLDEGARVQHLIDAGMDLADAVQFLMRHGGPSGNRQSLVVDVRTDNMLFLNDLEREPQYARFSSSIRDLLQPAYPNQLRFLRKNLVGLVFCIDPAVPEQSQFLPRIVMMLNRLLPLRFGLVVIDSDDTVTRAALEANAPGDSIALQLGNAVAHLVAGEGGHLSAVRYIAALVDQMRLAGGAISSEMVRETFTGSWAAVAESFEPRYAALLRDALERGMHAGSLFVNGHFFELGQDWEGNVMSAYQQLIQQMRMHVQDGTLTNTDDVYAKTFEWASHLFPRVSRLAFDRAASYTPLPLPALRALPLAAADRKGVPGADDTVVIIAGRLTADDVRAAIAYARSEAAATAARIGLVDTRAGSRLMMQLFQIRRRKDGDSAPSFDDLVEHADFLFAGTDDVPELGGDDDATAQREPVAYPAGLTTLPPEQREIFDLWRASLLRHINGGERRLIVNGRVLVLGPEAPLTASDIDVAVQVERMQRPAGVAQAKSRLSEDALWLLCASVTSILGDAPPRAMRGPLAAGRLASVSGADESRALFRVTAVVDPLSKEAQLVSGACEMLRSVDGVRVSLRLVAPAAESLHGRYYRYVHSGGKPYFMRSTGAARAPQARFGNMPSNLLLTLGMDVPQPWLVSAEVAVHDLDNIRIEEGSGDVRSRFVIEGLLVEGHCYDQFGHPPRGLQLVLTTPAMSATGSGAAIADTIVMANYGYFQLQARPGVWSLRVREGRSADVYAFADGAATRTVSVAAFAGDPVRARVAKRPGMESEDVLVQPETGKSEEKGGMWERLRGVVTGESGKQRVRTADLGDEATEKVHVFSVASGHLYERFLRLMMVSVKRHTPSPVKFWFIKNFLSPQFKETLPVLAEHYGFEYEYVTYKWPAWLRRQTEKQRIIWGYKILFLDVIFPLDLDKVIFVDADQIVRGDLAELMRMDLKGAPYGYVPFCDSRKETDGFRFWRGGWWSNHLQGKPYHISALYVVDLVRFRQMAAGDHLRGQYNALSSDPASLANLDQDLPNHLQHMVPIFSLPQEWLWCETWCSDESLATAKTIDLCNNPLTKEPKLSVAKRLLPEWQQYDDEIARVLAGNPDPDAQHQHAHTEL